MKAFRLILKVKPGCMDKALEMAKKVKEFAPDYTGRIYTPAGFAPWETIVFEDTYESVAERDAYWEKYYDNPEFIAWWDEWNNEVAESGNSIEIWNLTEI
jgi:hypothetical protein